MVKGVRFLQSGEFEIVSHFIFDFFISLINEDKYIFKCTLDTLVSFSRFLGSFSYWFYYSFIIKITLHILYINTLPSISTTNIFSHFETCFFFPLFMVSFPILKFLL